MNQPSVTTSIVEAVQHESALINSIGEYGEGTIHWKVHQGKMTICAISITKNKKLLDNV